MITLFDVVFISVIIAIAVFTYFLAKYEKSKKDDKK